MIATAAHQFAVRQIEFLSPRQDNALAANLLARIVERSRGVGRSRSGGVGWRRAAALAVRHAALGRVAVRILAAARRRRPIRINNIYIAVTAFL